MTGAPVNDLVVNATDVPTPAAGATATFTVDMSKASLEPSEAGSGTRSLWWRLTPTRKTSITLDNNKGSRVINVISAADVTQAGTALTDRGTVALQAGKTYWIRWADTSGGAYTSFTWTLKAS